MTLDQIVHNRVAHMLGDALIRQTTLSAEVEVLRQQIAALQKQMEEPSEPQPPRDAP